jgi:UDP-N-acetylmuramoyl-L-alanyl-D-glutamate--2,6-diaminopimelate ligase
MSRRLSEILEGLDPRRIIGSTEVTVENIVTDSRRAAANSLFACMGGSKVDGHEFAQLAARAGATALLCERPVAVGGDVTQVVVEDVRRALASVSSRFHGYPSSKLRVVGVTGTNGKTTTVHCVSSILEAAGRRAGIIGTLGHRVGDYVERGPFTTPEAPELHGLMDQMVKQELGYCIMEVSSHALALSRVDHVDFDVVVFTNLSRDHLDFHGKWASYKASKMLLFGIGDKGRFLGEQRRAVVNVGDETGREVADLTPLPTLTYNLAGGADVEGRISELGETGIGLDVLYERRTTALHSGLRGSMNAENLLAAFAVATALGIDEEAILAGIANIKAIPGRMEFIDGPGRRAVVDYAHTPDALERLLRDVKRISTGRVICVFGCGGDRDSGKRPEMGSIAGRLADIVIVTSDNPRTEDPFSIIDDIEKGFTSEMRYEVVPDRAEAISRAAMLSAKGDVIVVAGKGHEDYQIIGETRIHFDDREVVSKAFGVIADAKA